MKHAQQPDFGLKCPHCGYVHTDPVKDFGLMKNGSSTEDSCESCDEPFKVITHRVNESYEVVPL